MLRDRLHHFAWRLAAFGMVVAAALVLVGGFLAGADRALSDSLVLAGFGVLIPSVLLGWLGLPAAARPLSFHEENLR
jgi:hypothetical protein